MKVLKRYQYNPVNVQLLNEFLRDQEFVEIVEEDIGPLKKVSIDWDKNKIFFNGLKESKQLLISNVLKDILHGHRRKR